MKITKNIGAIASAAMVVASLSACSTADKVKGGVAGAGDKVLGGDVASAEKAKLESQAAALKAREAELARRESALNQNCLLYTSPSPRDRQKSRMPSSA